MEPLAGIGRLMATPQLSAPWSTARRLAGFTRQMFRPQIYATYGVLWAAALEGSAALLGGTGATHWHPSWRTAVRAGTVVLVLLFLRMADEQKDLDYDRVHHPRRPLVTGAITAAELRGAMGAIALAVVAANAAIDARCALLASAAPLYALLLAAAERRSPRFRESLLTNLAATYPVQLILSGYLYLSLADTGEVAAGWRAVPLLLVFAGVFLHFEFARKTAWRDEPGQRLYSGTALGPRGSGAVALAMAGAAGALELALFRPWQAGGMDAAAAWLPYSTFALPVLGAWQFFIRRRPSWPVPPAMCFVLFSYLALVVQAAALGRNPNP